MGYCRFENVSTPYNLQLNYWSTVYYFKGINIRNPKIAPIDNGIPNTNFCFVPVKFPEIEYHKSGYVRFISQDLFIQDYENFYLIEDYNTSIRIKIEIPVDKDNISGKLIFMQCYGTTYTAFDIWQYFNFGIKDVNLHTGINDTVEFTPKDIEFNPEENEVSTDVLFPESYTYNRLVYYISFPGYNKKSDIMIGDYRNVNWSISQTVPSNLLIPFNIKVESSYYTNEDYFLNNLQRIKIINLQPGETGNIQHEKINLLSPQNNAEGINSNSILKAEDTPDKGIYVFCIGLRGDTLEPSAYIFTDKNEIKLNDKLNYFSLSPNTWYTWKAGKICTFNSIDDFVLKPFSTNENFNSIELSEKWHFKTAP